MEKISWRFDEEPEEAVYEEDDTRRGWVSASFGANGTIYTAANGEKFTMPDPESAPADLAAAGLPAALIDRLPARKRVLCIPIPTNGITRAEAEAATAAAHAGRLLSLTGEMGEARIPLPPTGAATSPLARSCASSAARGSTRTSRWRTTSRAPPRVRAASTSTPAPDHAPSSRP
jgi:hypothetical protein